MESSYYISIFLETISEFSDFNLSEVQFSCNLCGIVFNNKHSKIIHMNENNHTEIDPNLGETTCEYCLVNFLTDKKLKKHQKICNEDIGKELLKDRFKLMIYESVAKNSYKYLGVKTKKEINPYNNPDTAKLMNQEIILKLLENKETFFISLVNMIWFNKKIPNNMSFRKVSGLNVLTNTDDGWCDLNIETITENINNIVCDVAYEMLILIGYNDNINNSDDQLLKSIEKKRGNPDSSFYYIIIDENTKQKTAATKSAKSTIIKSTVVRSTKK